MLYAFNKLIRITDQVQLDSIVGMSLLPSLVRRYEINPDIMLLFVQYGYKIFSFGIKTTALYIRKNEM